MELSFVIPFPLVPKERPRLGRHGVYTPSRTIRFEKSVGMLALAARPAGWPLDVRYAVTIGAKTRADVDNVSKSVFDAGNKGILWHDDSQVDYLLVGRQRDGSFVTVETIDPLNVPARWILRAPSISGARTASEVSPTDTVPAQAVRRSAGVPGARSQGTRR